MGCGAATALSVFAATVLILLVALVVLSQLPSGGVTKSTVRREALPGGSAVETEYFTDQLDWIGNRSELQTGMRNFYQKTGVQPYLFITGDRYYTADDVLENLYDELFRDEAHLLLVFCEYQPEAYEMRYLAGRQAKSVLDNEAMDILMDYIDRYYYSSMTEEAFFSKAFSDAGGRIMEVTASPWIPVWIVLGVVVILIVLFQWWKAKKRQRNIEDENTKEILNTPLETFNDTSGREDKYK